MHDQVRAENKRRFEVCCFLQNQMIRQLFQRNIKLATLRRFTTRPDFSLPQSVRSSPVGALVPYVIESTGRGGERAMDM